MNLYPLHKELLSEAVNLLAAKYAQNPTMAEEVMQLRQELTDEGMIEQ